MLTLRLVRRFGTRSRLAAVSGAGNTSKKALVSKRKRVKVDEPALFRLKKEKNPEKLFQLFKENAHNKIVIENRYAFEDTVSRLAGVGRFDYIENLLEHQKTLPQGRREGFIIRIIMLYGKAGMIQNAIKTFYDMHLYGCPRTVKSFNAALKVLTQSHDMEAIESFLWDVPERFSINIDILSVNTIISSFCSMGTLEKAYLFMVEMEKLGISPDVFTYTILISAFYKVNRWQIADGLWNLMVRKGCMPNVATFNVRIQFMVNMRFAWEANKLLQLMKRIGITPDEVTYNLVIKGFFLVENLPMAKRIYSAFHDAGFKTNSRIYQTMIHYLCRAGDFDLSYSMCKESMKNNWFPSSDIIKNILEGLCKDGTEEKMGNARFLVILAKKKIPPFSTETLNMMREVQWGLKDVWKYNGNLICTDNIPVFHLPHQSIHFHDWIILLLSLSWLLKGSSVEQKRRATLKSFQLYNYHVHNYERTSHYQDINIVRSTLKAITTDTCLLLAELKLQSRIEPPSRPS